MTGQCKFDGNLFCFFFPPAKKEERNPTHIAAHCQATLADAQTKACQRATIYPAHK